MGLKIVLATSSCLSSVSMGPAQPFLQHTTLVPVAMMDTQPSQITELPCVSSLLPAAEQNIDRAGEYIHKEI